MSSGKKKSAKSSSTSSPAKASSSPDLPSLFAELLSQQGSSDFERGVRTANKILHLSPHDADAFHCKMVCLLQLGKFEELLKQVFDNEDKVKVDLAFEKAYALYRLNRSEEALDALNSATNNKDVRVKELKAQVLYRLERYEESYELYRGLIKNTSDDFDVERLTNFSAVAVYLSQQKGAKAAPAVDEEDTFELCYNKASHLLGQSKWVEAEKELLKAVKMCR